MDRPTFLDRRPLGIPNYLVLALVAMLLVALVPRGARKGLQSNTNRVEDWLPASYTESQELDWFRAQFGGEAFVLVSWDGCTLGNQEQLKLLGRKLTSAPLSAEVAKAAGVSPHADRRTFSRVVTGPGMIEELTAPPARLSEPEAIERLQGALIGPPATEGDNATRTTCLIAYLGEQAAKNNRSIRAAIDQLKQVAQQHCGLQPAELHMGGPPVDNVAIDIEGERTLRRLAGLSGLVGLVLAYACFRSWRLTLVVLTVAVISAGASIAVVYYYGAFEVLGLGKPTRRLGRLDAILMSMPAVVYVLSLSGAIHLVNYYRDAVAAGGRRGAVERAIRMAIVPCVLSAATTAIGLASLASSDILPIEKFGVFSAIGVLLAVVLLFTILPVMLHRFAPRSRAAAASDDSACLPPWARGLAEGICRRHGLVVTTFGALMLLLALGLPRIEPSIKLIKLLDEQSDLVQDYAWLEAHLGNLVPMEVVIAVPPQLRRGVNELPGANGQHYAMTTVERLALIRRVSEQMELLEPVSKSLSAATFSPGELDSRSPSNRRTYDYILSKALDENRDYLAEYLKWEHGAPSDAAQPTRELWRASARVAALADVDYGMFVGDIKARVEPVLSAYHARSQLVAKLAEQGQQLAGSRLTVVVGEDPSLAERTFVQLLREAGVSQVMDGRRGQLAAIKIDALTDASPQAIEQLKSRDAVVAIDNGVADQLAQRDIEPLLLSTSTVAGEGLEAVYTGVMPLVYKTQRELLVSLEESLVLATLLITGMLVVLLRSLGGGLASMIPNLFPLVAVFGALGWLGINVDIGIMMTASVALGVAVDDTIHFVSWFRRGLAKGLTRFDAAMLSYERCGTAMLQTTLVAGLGLAVFAASTFTPTQQFGVLMVTILAAALVGDLILLPALLVGPLGALFGSAGRTAAGDDDSGVLTAEDGGHFASQPSPATAEVEERNRQYTPPSPLPAETAGASPPMDDSSPQPTEPAAPERVSRTEPAHDELSPNNAALRDRLRRFRRDDAQR